MDAGRGLLPAHSPGVRLHLRGATGQVAGGSRLDPARSLHPCLLSASADLQRQRTVSSSCLYDKQLSFIDDPLRIL